MAIRKRGRGKVSRARGARARVRRPRTVRPRPETEEMGKGIQEEEI